ncbi:double zinc ribbon domain-containing protein [Rickettsia amblyommatis]|uniref:double zinc ribbon domain-containing protein n=1 Tax=Rickettsia amblyommatis TaxID=33989 RepID=UPI0006A7AA42|nr:double zinc ribbon domain-containing protein [Rickettsia amblyommatis]ALA61896.1 competence protein ComF [Rickettsia amblyommatis]
MLIKTYNYPIDYILPQRCLSGAEILGGSGEFCSDYWKKLEFIARPYCSIYRQRFSIKIFDNCICGNCYSNKPNYEFARSLFKFNEHSKKIVHQFKYQDKTIFAKTFAKLLYNRYSEDIKDIDFNHTCTYE